MRAGGASEGLAAEPRLRPVTVKAARRAVRARGLGRVPEGHVVAVLVGDPASLVAGGSGSYATGGPDAGGHGAFEVRVYSATSAEGVADAEAAADAVGRAALEMGYARAYLWLPPWYSPSSLKRSGWSESESDFSGRRWTLTARRSKGKMWPVPMSQAEANRWVARTHSHLPPSRGSMFSVGVAGQDGVHCVAQVGVVRARMLMRSGRVAEVVRVASDRTANAASMALGAVVRACLALGFTRVVSYTMLGETGHSYRVSGWRPVSVSGGGEWSRKSRARPKAVQSQRKVRWEIGPGARLAEPSREREIYDMIASAVGAARAPAG